MRPRDHDRHKLGSAGWLRAAVLGASDGIVSTSSLLLGLAAARSSHGTLLLGGTAALVGGAMSMAAGEYVSVYSQADSEAAALAEERAELRADFAGERRELKEIYIRRGVELCIPALPLVPRRLVRQGRRGECEAGCVARQFLERAGDGGHDRRGRGRRQ